MRIAYLSEYPALGQPVYWLVALPGTGRPATQPAALEASPAALLAMQLGWVALPEAEADTTPPATAEELTRDLAGWAMPQAEPTSVGPLAAAWLW